MKKDKKKSQEKEIKKNEDKEKVEKKEPEDSSEEGGLEEEVEESVETSEFESTPESVGAVTPILERANEFQEENMPVRLERRAEEFEPPANDSKGTEEMYAEEKTWDYETQTSTRQVDYSENPVLASETRMEDQNFGKPTEMRRESGANQQLQDLRGNDPQRDEYLAHETKLDDPDPTVAVQDRKIEYKI
tara:strand:+ start:4534 stop:5103 length:570 start_codon:yes stop_codon:yes gene_type:complete